MRNGIRMTNRRATRDTVPSAALSGPPRSRHHRARTNPLPTPKHSPACRTAHRHSPASGNLMGCAPAVHIVPSDAIEWRVTCRRAASTCRIFPLRFGWQPHFRAFAISPWHRPTSPFSTGNLIALVELLGLPPIDFLICRLRHRRLANPKTFRDCHRVRRFFIILAFGIIRRAAHLKRARRNPNVGEAVLRVDLGFCLRRRPKESRLLAKRRQRQISTGVAPRIRGVYYG